MNIRPFRIIAVATFGLAIATPSRALDEAPTAEQLAFFEKKIRPVLSEKCYKCHSEKSEKIRGGLTLDTREGIRRGGDNGPAVVPGDLKESLLIDAVRYSSKDTAMPPEKSGGKLPPEMVADLEAWVKMGAPDPRAGAAKIVRKFDTEEAKKWWAFQPIAGPAAPAATPWAQSELDGFVAAGLAAKGLKPVADADASTLLRRLYFDLIGLPPTQQELAAFYKEWNAAGSGRSAISNQQSAIEKTVDRLLASPQFGERWGRHWLDVARFAESSGKDVNIAFPNAWRYRDYVVAAFNADKPFDQFIREQIAGDLLPAKDDRQRAEQVVATGFLAIGPKGLNEQNARQFALDVADEQIDTVSQAFLGMTVACARCHDHKFDPIPQRDYYAMAGIFLSTDTHYGTPAAVQNRHSTDLLELPKGAGAPTLGATLSVEEKKRKETQLAALKAEQQQIFKERMANRGKADAPQKPGGQLRPLIVLTQIGELETELKSFDETGYAKALAMGVQDYPTTPRMAGGGYGFGAMIGAKIRARFGGRPPELSRIGDSALYARGDVEKPGDKVPRGFVNALSTAAAPAISPGNSGRKELADWIASPANPLTSRVIANRAWHWLFGQGIVESTDNFGTTGTKPSNQALLDHLATRLVADGWSMKKLIREIVLSRTYRMSSAFDEKNFAADPENALVWRMSKKRLDAECLRDAMLSVAGTLDLKAPTGSLIAKAGDGPIARRGPRRGGVGEEAIIEAGGNQRSVYLPVARDVLPDALAVFDFAEPSLVTGARETTNVPSQALYMLNSAFVTTQSQALANRVLAAIPGGPNAGAAANLEQRLAAVYWQVFGRAPDAVERQAASNFLAKFPSNWSKGDKSAPGLRDASDVKAAWTSLCRALFASAEFRYLN